MRIELVVAAAIVPFCLATPAQASQDNGAHVVKVSLSLDRPETVIPLRPASDGDIAVLTSDISLPQPFSGPASTVDTSPSPTVLIFEPVNSSALALASVDNETLQAEGPDLVNEPTAPENDKKAPSTRDPLRPFNRVMWGFNRKTDRFMFKPVSTAYRTVIPKFMRRGVGNAFDNLSEPWSAVNNVLQAKPGRALDNVGRFAVNTTVGLGGLTDRATQFGIRRASEDFGQTLASWGVKSSAYLVLPLFGPSTIRDGIGTGVAFFADPVQIGINQSGLSGMARLGLTGLEITSRRAALTESGADAFLKTSPSPYDAARDGYFQRRALEIADKDGTN